MKLENKEMLEELLEGVGDWKMVVEGEWVQDCKFQLLTVIVEYLPTGKFYRCTIGRSGSPFTDWEYDHDYGDLPDLEEVVQVEKTITVWEAV